MHSRSSKACRRPGGLSKQEARSKKRRSAQDVPQRGVTLDHRPRVGADRNDRRARLASPADGGFDEPAAKARSTQRRHDLDIVDVKRTAAVASVVQRGDTNAVARKHELAAAVGMTFVGNRHHVAPSSSVATYAR